MPRKTGRKWAPPKGPSKEINDLAVLLRGWIDGRGLTLNGLIEKLTLEHFQGMTELPKRSTIAEWLSGVSLRWDFVEAVIDICTEDSYSANEYRNQAKRLWRQAEQKKNEEDKSGILNRVLNKRNVLAWLTEAPDTKPLVTDTTSRKLSPQAIADSHKENESAARITGTLLDTTRAEEWPALISSFRKKGKAAHAQSILSEIGKQAAPHKLPSIIEFMRINGGFLDDREIITSAAVHRSCEDLALLVEFLEMDQQKHSAELITQSIGIARPPGETVSIIVWCREQQHVEILDGILQGAAKWRTPKSFIELIRELRRVNLHEAADLVIYAAGVKRPASTFPELARAMKEGTDRTDLQKLASAAGAHRSRNRMKPLVGSLIKNGETEFLKLLQQYALHERKTPYLWNFNIHE
ncbi:hypothetical protein [Streptomyces sp. NPDC059171]|uniref:hypothetical protein n=1 Tax=Streptomyces sp. NPDC059171 TaxID=3346755 RepID=UPI0036992969